jgi:hypothetical protein
MCAGLSVLVLALLQCAFLNNLSVSVNAAKFHGGELAEYERSMARIRVSMEAELWASSPRQLLQVNVRLLFLLSSEIEQRGL